MRAGAFNRATLCCVHCPPCIFGLAPAAHSLSYLIQGFIKEHFADWASSLTFLPSLNQPQAEWKTQPPNLHQTWEGFHRKALYTRTHGCIRHTLQQSGEMQPWIARPSAGKRKGSAASRRESRSKKLNAEMPKLSV